MARYQNARQRSVIFAGACVFLLGLTAAPDDASAATVLCRNAKGTKVT
jgi:hypothetical protein